MLYVWATALTIVNAVWLATVLVGLPGTWLIVVTTAAVAWWKRDAETGAMFGAWTLVAVAALATVAEIVEFGAGVAGSRVAGGSKGGAMGALIGGVIGGILGTVLIPVPLIGSVLGASIGAGIGAVLMEIRAGRRLDESVRSGVGAGAGRFAGTTAKLALGAVMWVVVAVAAYWP